MTFWQTILLGILQGATEFLPVSSSGHLVIVPYLLGWPQPSLALDAMLHLGTLAAVLIYFRADLARLVAGVWRALQQRSLDNPDARLALYLVIATIPGVMTGLLLEDIFEELFSAPAAAAAFLLVTAAVLILAELLSKRERLLESLTPGKAAVIGLAQAAAIAPGLSRSGSTIAAGMLLGLRRDDAARFSFLLSIPIILGSGGLQFLKLVTSGAGSVNWLTVGLAMAAAALVGYAAISSLLALVRRHSLWPFAAYCALLGTLVLTGILK